MATNFELVDTNGSALGNFNDGKVPCDCVTTSVEDHNALVHGYSYQFPFSATPAAPANEFLYIKNDSSTDTIKIEAIELTDAGAEVISFGTCTGTAGGTLTTITPVSRNSAAANTPDVTVKSSADATGLTPTAVLNYTTTADAYVDILRGVPFFVGPGKAVCLSAATGTALISGNVWFSQLKHPTAA